MKEGAMSLEKLCPVTVTFSPLFHLLGFTGSPQLQTILFVVFLVIYIVTLVDNLGMIALIMAESQLHTPMYFFLLNLSLIDTVYSSVIAPRALVNFLAECKAVSFAGCTMQFFFLSLCANAEALLLSVMAYDRFIAICKPLLYTIIMSRKVCVQLVAASYFYAFVNAIVHTGSLFSLSFCGPKIIDHFFCDIPSVQKLSCSSTHKDSRVHFVFAAVTALSTVLIILISYIYIILNILRIRSVEGRRKAFLTCTSHLTSISILYGTLFFMYLQPTSSNSSDQDKVMSVFYTLVIPMLNPLIYSLRNKKAKHAMRKVIYRTMNDSLVVG
ncbi:LOW QUALITY PROTEIN: olfactory receptor 1052-like [Gopherus evgoodei]|uniref:LOW QUALITY PROTEIN: olfactory receptor 1052-like n=1 Tax=Gopherus evgoodei TaxID=1825980 RepID=UPI0011D028C6|nr:LOW QUALITY PROTEIN: olfactory receptor 1052-like [Gopherus evgoodei]